MSQSLEKILEESWLATFDGSYLSSLEECDLIQKQDLLSFTSEYNNLIQQKIIKHGVIQKPEKELSNSNSDINQKIRHEAYLYADLNPLERPKAWDLLGQTPIPLCYHNQKLAIEANTLSEKEQEWCYSFFESLWGSEKESEADLEKLLDIGIAAEGFERYLGTQFPGAKRFSLEGLESFNGLLYHIIEQSALKYNTNHIVVGLSHRGRLNALVNLLGKNPQELFDEFRGVFSIPGYSGDVKYHQGISHDFLIENRSIKLSAPYNPSHLESVGAIVEGLVRAEQDNSGNPEFVLPIITHGDSAFCGQGIVMELFNMSQTRGYGTEGTIHIVMNNQVGFTASKKEDTRSTQLCTDIAKMMSIPVVHVNASDWLATKKAACFALAWRYTFKKDCIVHLIGYRKYGHNEADEPTVTQPLMYQAIAKQKSSLEKIELLLKQNYGWTEQKFSAKREFYRANLNIATYVSPWLLAKSPQCMRKRWGSIPISSPDFSGVALERLKALGQSLIENIHSVDLHPRVAKIYEERKNMYAGQKELDWGAAEALAYATLLDQGYHIRLSGQDSRRGTFFQRHCFVVDQKTELSYSPFSKWSNQFEAIDSILSEEAVLGFEYGYSLRSPQHFVLWEAQFGDFANGAQVVIDQYIASGGQKWGQESGLTLLLPHGYEGQGPEHSSARIERFLQLAAQDNMRICYPSTPSQYFHLLRWQMLEGNHHPLVIFTPKSLLRHPEAVSQIEKLSQGEFQKVIADEQDKQSDLKRETLVFCTGKIYYELKDFQKKHELSQYALIRLEQLYPFPEKELMTTLQEHKLAKKIIWAQEEPENQGAWRYFFYKIKKIMPDSHTLQYCGRAESSSTATGWSKQHKEEQEAIINNVFQFS